MPVTVILSTIAAAAAGYNVLTIPLVGKLRLKGVEVRFPETGRIISAGAWLEFNTSAAHRGTVQALGLCNGFISTVESLKWHGDIKLEGVNLLVAEWEDCAANTAISVSALVEMVDGHE